MSRWLKKCAGVAQEAAFHSAKKCLAAKERPLACFFSQTTCVWSFLASAFSFTAKPGRAQQRYSFSVVHKSLLTCHEEKEKLGNLDGILFYFISFLSLLLT